MASKISDPRYIAHRGGLLSELVQDSSKAKQYENTLQAFEDALKAAIKHWETDCHVTKDGVLVAFHDDLLPNGESISSYTQTSLKKEYPRIPTLEEILLLARKNFVTITIDAKNADEATALDEHDNPRNHILLVDAIVALDMQNDVILGGFNTKRTNEMRERAQNKHGIEIATSPAFGGLIRLLEQYFRYTLTRAIPFLSNKKILTKFQNENKFVAFQMPARAGVIFFAKDQQGKRKLIQKAFGDDAYLGIKLLSSKQLIGFVHKLGAEAHFWGYVEKQKEILRILENKADALIGNDRKINTDTIRKYKQKSERIE